MSNIFFKIARLRYPEADRNQILPYVQHVFAVRNLSERNLLSSERWFKAFQPYLLPEFQSMDRKEFAQSINSDPLLQQIVSGDFVALDQSTVPGWSSIPTMIALTKTGTSQLESAYPPPDQESASRACKASFVADPTPAIVFYSLARCYSEKLIPGFFQDIESTIDHELRHYQQTLYPGKAPGIPSKKFLHSNIDQDGLIKQGPHAGKQVHPVFIPMEIFPYLHSAADNFVQEAKEKYGDATPEELDELLKIRMFQFPHPEFPASPTLDDDPDLVSQEINQFHDNYRAHEKTVGKFKIAPSMLFYSWKRFSPALYRFGVKEFIKMVQPKLDFISKKSLQNQS